MSMNPRLLRPTASGFNPRQISGLALWLDGADSSSLYTTDAGPVVAVASPLDIAGCALWLDGDQSVTQSLFDATSGGSAVTTNGGSVARWEDKSGNGRHFVQSSAPVRPTLSTAARNGRSVVTFDATGDYMISAATQTIPQPATWMFVYKVPSSIASGWTLVDSATDRVHVYSPGGATITQYTAGGFFTTEASGVTADQWRIGTYHFNGASSLGKKDGVQTATGTTGTNASTGNIYLGANLGSAFSLRSQMAEAIFLTGASMADTARVEAYLAAKWGIANVHAPATSASQPVGYWRDRSGNGRHATQSTAASRPTIGSQNGRRALSANGTSHDMALTNAGGVTRNAPGVTIIAALSPNTVASIRSAVLFSIGTSAAARTLLQFNGAELRAGGRRLDADSFDSATGGTIVANQPIVAVARLDYANANAVAYSNSAPLATDTSFLTAGLVSDTASQASSIMNSSGGFFFYSGIFAELLVYNRALTDAERRKAEIYLARKWGITLAPQVSNADAQDWVNRVYANGGTVSTSTANAVNTFCAAIDTAGIRDRFYRLNLFCGTGLNAALVPLYRNTSLAGPALGNATDTNSGALFVSGDYTEPTGLTGGTNKHLNTGLAPDNMPLGVVQAMALSFSHGPTPNLNTDPRPVGAAAISPVTERFVLILTIRSSVTGVLSSTLGRGNALLSAQIAAGPQPSASWVASRTSATSLVAYKNGIADATLATTVTPIASHALPFFVCRSNEGGVATGSAIALPHRHYSIGAGLTGSEVASYDTALAAFRSAIGRTA